MSSWGIHSWTCGHSFSLLRANSERCKSLVSYSVEEFLKNAPVSPEAVWRCWQTVSPDDQVAVLQLLRQHSPFGRGPLTFNELLRIRKHFSDSPSVGDMPERHFMEGLEDKFCTRETAFWLLERATRLAALDVMRMSSPPDRTQALQYIFDEYRRQCAKIIALGVPVLALR